MGPDSISKWADLISSSIYTPSWGNSNSAIKNNWTLSCSGDDDLEYTASITPSNISVDSTSYDNDLNLTISGVISSMNTYSTTSINKEKHSDNKYKASVEIKKVIFNDPATIVFWKDGSKTVVQANNEPFDPEKGLAMAIVKKVYGNKGNYCNIFKKYIPED